MKRIVVLAVFALWSLASVLASPQEVQAQDCSPHVINWGLDPWGFWQFSGNQPLGWYTDQFVQPQKASLWSSPGEVVISSPGRTVDARWAKWVNVCPWAYYLLEGDLMTENVFADRTQLLISGANVSVLDCVQYGDHENCFISSQGLVGSNWWTHVQTPVLTGSSSQIRIAARLGMYSGMAGGVVHARNIRFSLIHT